jgi:hypothetical protein
VLLKVFILHSYTSSVVVDWYIYDVNTFNGCFSFHLRGYTLVEIHEPWTNFLPSSFHFSHNDRPFQFAQHLQWDGPIILLPPAIIKTILSANCKRKMILNVLKSISTKKKTRSKCIIKYITIHAFIPHF